VKSSFLSLRNAHRLIYFEDGFLNHLHLVSVEDTRSTLLITTFLTIIEELDPVITTQIRISSILEEHSHDS
jgi:hypothetical protein